jgi:hypothetical protein
MANATRSFTVPIVVLQAIPGVAPPPTLQFSGVDLLNAIGRAAVGSTFQFHAGNGSVGFFVDGDLVSRDSTSSSSSTGMMARCACGCARAFGRAEVFFSFLYPAFTPRRVLRASPTCRAITSRP